jgi:hypothetical protein
MIEHPRNALFREALDQWERDLDAADEEADEAEASRLRASAVLPYEARILAAERAYPSAEAEG